MSYLLILMAIAGIDPSHTLRQEALRLGVPQQEIVSALRAPQRPKSFKPEVTRYCLDDHLINATPPKLICRSLDDWHALGFELTGEPNNPGEKALERVTSR